MTGFGTSTSFPSFGFGSNTQNPFGQTQRFGAPTSTAFGTATPAFGQSTTPMFGAPQQSAPLFGTPASSAPAFGTNTQNVFGSNTLFGQQSQPQPGTSLFGSGTSTFGQQNKTTAFNFPSTPSTGLFGQTAAQQPQQQNIFQTPSTSSMFGTSSFGTPQVQSGTSVKFVPVTGTDTMQKGGTSSMINTKHYSITFMKEYEGKSFEELRFEDYGANRKGPQQSTGFGSTTPAFGTSVPAFGAVASSAPSMFGQTENKSVFGAQTSTFGQTTPFGIGAQTSTTPNVFGKTTTPFGAPATSTSTFGFGTPSTNMFGPVQAAKPFGAQPTQPLFSQSSTGFGTNTLFGQPATAQQNTSSFFNKPAQPTFSTPQTGTFGFGQTPASTQASTLFQTTKPSFSLFGQNTTTTNTFGQQQPTGFGGFNSFAKPAQPAFGQPTQTPAFGTGSNLQTNNLFGNVGAKPAFGANTGSGLFMGSTTQQPNNSFSFQTQPANQPLVLSSQPQAAALRSMLDYTDPYGFSPHFDGLSAIKKSETHYATNPKDIESVLKLQDNQSSTGLQKNLKVYPPVTNKNKWYLFESNYEKIDYNTLDIRIKPSAKRLNLKGGPSKKPEPVVVYQNGKIVGEDTPHTFDFPLQTAFTPIDSEKIQKDATEKEEASTSKSTETVLETNKTATEPIIEERTAGEKEIEVGTPIVRKEKPKTSTSEGIDTCGIICTRPEYYTIPPLGEISKFKNEDGTCIIRGFTIGRVGYGNVYFPEAMDVSNLNIDELVHFRYREICIYTDDELKPPVGEGLNRKAQVTLDRVYPKKEKNRQEFETDPQELINNQFADSLKSVCLKSNTTFLDYRPETGSWVFNVPHFSKYGFADSEDECDEKMVVEKNPANELGARNKTVEKNKKLEEASNLGKDQKSPKKGLGGISEQELGKSMDLCNYETLQHGDFSGRQMDYEQDMIMSPYGKNLASANMPYNYTITSVTDPIVDMNIQNVTSPFMKQSFVEVPQKNKTLCDYKELFYEDDIYYQPPSKKITESLVEEKIKSMPTQSSVIKIKPKINRYKLQNTSMYVPLSKSLISSRAFMDMAVFKGRSFKVGWGRGFTMTGLLGGKFVSSEIGGQTNVNPSCVLLLDGSRLQESSTPETPDNDPFMNYISNFMEIVRDTTIFSLHKDDSGLWIPRCIERRGVEMLRELTKLANDLSEIHKENVKMRYYANIWNLCMAFWDKIEDDNYTARRELFSNWLENVTGPLVNEDLITHQFESNEENIRKMLINLSGHKIRKAVELCFKTDSPQLAMLFSQLSSTTFGRHCMQFQLSLWDSTFATEHIDSEVLKLYLIFSGMPFYKDINVCENMDWVRSLGMYFWYFVPSWKSVGYALDYYEKAVENDYVAKPYPILAKQSTGTWDILFHLMKLFKNEKLDLDDLLSPLTHTDNRCDFRLSWLMYKAFLAMSVGVLSERTKIELTTVFSAQLEQLGLFKWAIFVLLFLDDITMKKQLVCAVLDRNITDAPNPIENELVCDIKIPKEWIHTVKAYQTRQLENYWEAYKHLACSQMWYECSDVVLLHLAPHLVANDKYLLLKKILLPLSTRDNHPKVAIIVEFIKFWEMLHEDEEGINKVSANETFKELSNLVLALKHYSNTSPDQCMIISEISKYCFKFLLSLLKKMNPTSDTVLQNFEYVSQQLVMPFDYRYVQSNKFVSFTKFKQI